MTALLLSFAAGVVAATGFAPLSLWPLTILGFAFLLWQIERAPSLRSALARSYWFAAGHFMLGLNWIATAFTFQAKMPAWLGWLAVVLLSLYLAVYPAMAGGLAWRWGRRDRLRLALVFAAAWIVTEWLRATMFTGFAWNPEGVALIGTPLAPLATLVGTYGLSGVLMLIAGALLILAKKDQRAALIIGPVALAALAIPLLRGGEIAADPIALRIVQPDIGQQDRWREGFEEETYARLGRLSAGGPPGPRLLLWPESAVTEPLEDARAMTIGPELAEETRARVASLMRPDDLLLTGGITLRSNDGVDVSSATNSVFAMDGSGRILARYDKAHLVPYGEYLPMRPLLSAIGVSRLAPGDIDYDSGPGPRTIDLPLVGPVGFQLCYEIIFSGEVVDHARRPRFLFNPSNDAWFGAWGPPQHLAQARLRALEEGIPVVRATPTGISAVIDADGRVTQALGWRVAGAIDAALPQARTPTWFARTGNLAAFLFATLLAALAVASRRRLR